MKEINLFNLEKCVNYNNILKQVFGFDELREFQKNVVDSVLNDDDIIVISPTGSGKSLCFQLPAVIKKVLLLFYHL